MLTKHEIETGTWAVITLKPSIYAIDSDSLNDVLGEIYEERDAQLTAAGVDIERLAHPMPLVEERIIGLDFAASLEAPANEESLSRLGINILWTCDETGDLAVSYLRVWVVTLPPLPSARESDVDPELIVDAA